MYLQGIFGGARRAVLEEHELFVYLAEYNLRLEQERISQTYALKQLEVAQSSAVLSQCRGICSPAGCTHIVSRFPFAGLSEE